MSIMQIVIYRTIFNELKQITITKRPCHYHIFSRFPYTLALYCVSVHAWMTSFPGLPFPFSHYVLFLHEKCAIHGPSFIM